MQENYKNSIKNIGNIEAKQIVLEEEMIRGNELDQIQTSKPIQYYNEYGAFFNEGKEYVIKVNEDSKLPTVWSHILANKHFGTVLTEGMGGYTWSDNSRLNRISAWNNNPCFDIPSEFIYLKDLENKKEDIGSVTFVDKVKNIQPTKKQPTRKGVYEDHYILRYVKYAIVIIIVIAIIIVLGYSFVFMKSNDSLFINSNTSITDTSETLKKKTTETDKKKTTKSDTTKKDEQTSTEITFTKNADGDYSFKLPDGYDQETFKLKVDFTFATTVDLHVNGDPNSYQTDTFKKGVYSSNLANISASDALKDDSACESVELEFNVNDFQYLEFSYSWNLGHRYYINDQKIPLEENDHYGTSSNGRVRTFKLTMVK